MQTPSKNLEEYLLEKIATRRDAFHFYDELDTVDISRMKGLWIRKKLPKASWFSESFSEINWYGKEFISSHSGYPLVMEKRNKERYYLNPSALTFLPLRQGFTLLYKPSFLLFSPLLRTKRPKAVLEMTEYRGKVSATLLYERQDIKDIYRKIDDQTLFGITEFGNSGKQASFFLLEKDFYS